MGIPNWARVLFFLLALGFLQLVITSLSSQNGGIVSQIQKGLK